MSQDSTDVGDKISVAVGHKKNMGNYESMDWHISVTVTKRPNETTDEAFDRAWPLVFDQLDEQVGIANAALGEKRK